MTYLNHFLDTLQSELPTICSDKDLVKHLPNIFKNPGTLHRMRARGQAPAFFAIEPNIYYLREDVVCWLRERYQGKEILIPQVKIKRAIRKKRQTSGVQR